jgi:phenylalanine-4-hydroxylase
MSLTEQGFISLKKEIKSCKKYQTELIQKEMEWEVLVKHNKFRNKAFTKLDKRISKIYKTLSERKFSNYPLRTQDDVLGYIEHLEIQVEDFANLQKDGMEKKK